MNKICNFSLSVLLIYYVICSIIVNGQTPGRPPFRPSSQNINWQTQQGPGHIPGHNTKATGNNGKSPKQFWLIPRDPINCLPQDLQTIIYVDKDKVSLTDCSTGSKTLKFPGCARLKADVQVLQELSTNLFANIQFQWANLPSATESIKCTKQEPNGCGGIGNNCFYCDVCKSLQQLQNDHKFSKNLNSDHFECPTQPKIYKLEKTLNVTDWSALDSNNNGVIDLLEDDNLQKVRDYLKAVDVAGFGTLSVNFQIATNATAKQKSQKSAEEEKIRNDVARKYQPGQRSAAEIRREAQTEINYWHKNSYLPWLLKTNQIACVTFLFDVCLNEPSPFNVRGASQCT